MQIECRYVRECADYMSPRCGRCDNNKIRNAPKTRFVAAADADLTGCHNKNGAYLTRIVQLWEGLREYQCPACGCGLGYITSKDEDDEFNESVCPSCGLKVIYGPVERTTEDGGKR